MRTTTSSTSPAGSGGNNIPSADKDPGPLFLLLGGAFIGLALVVLAWRRAVVVRARAARALEKKKLAALGEWAAREEAREEAAALVVAVSGSLPPPAPLPDVPLLTPEGRPRCRAGRGACPTEATYPSPIIVRAGPWEEFVGSFFNAPQRFRVLSPDRDEENPARYCEPHVRLAEQEARAELAEIERSRQAALRDVEVRLAKFERGGLEEKMMKHVGEEKPR